MFAIAQYQRFSRFTIQRKRQVPSDLSGIKRFAAVLDQSCLCEFPAALLETVATQLCPFATSVASAKLSTLEQAFVIASRLSQCRTHTSSSDHSHFFAFDNTQHPNSSKENGCSAATIWFAIVVPFDFDTRSDEAGTIQLQLIFDVSQKGVGLRRTIGGVLVGRGRWFAFPSHLKSSDSPQHGHRLPNPPPSGSTSILHVSTANRRLVARCPAVQCCPLLTGIAANIVLSAHVQSGSSGRGIPEPALDALPGFVAPRSCRCSRSSGSSCFATQRSATIFCSSRASANTRQQPPRRPPGFQSNTFRRAYCARSPAPPPAPPAPPSTSSGSTAQLEHSCSR